MAKIKEREEAQILRSKGNSIAEIAKQLRVSKSTVSMWCRDIVLSDKAMNKIIQSSNTKSTAGILRYTESLRKKRQDEVIADMDKGARMIGELSTRDIFCIGLGLYWGEGYKKGSQEFGFTNSDPAMIKFYIDWLQVVFGLDRDDLILRVSINAQHESRDKKVRQYWSEVTTIPLSQFTKTSFIKSINKKVYSNELLHYGTLRVKVRRGTAKRRQVLGAINRIKTSYDF